MANKNKNEIKNRNKMTNFPNLRFSEFRGEWENCAFSDIGTFFKGVGISKEQLTEEGTPCILYGELYTKYKNEIIKEVKSKTSINTKNLVFSKANDIIIPSSGETAIDISTACCVTLDNILLGGDLNVIRPYKHNGSFISYQLNGKRKYDIAKIAQGSSVIHLYNNSLKKLKINVPNDIKEEEKIVSLLSRIDNRITTQIQIIEELKTLMRGLRKKLFSQEMRFVEFEEDWEMKKLGEVLTIQGGYVFKSDLFNQGTSKVVRIGDIVPTIILNKFSGLFSTETPHEKYIVTKNDFVMALSGATFGKVGKIIDDGIAYINQRVATFRTKQCLEFFYQLVKTDNFRNYIASIPTASAQPNISNNDIANYVSAIPNINEQEKIANFLLILENKLAVEQKLLSEYQKQKKYLLNQLFI